MIGRNIKRAIVESLERRTLLAAQLLKDFSPASISPSSFNGRAYIRVMTSGVTPQVTSLWTTDGTPGGTVKLATVDSGVGDPSATDAIIGINGIGLFAAKDSHGSELWRTDGTPAGTFLLKDIVPGAGSSTPVQFTVSEKWVYFTVTDQLWRSDGTTAGTSMVKAFGTGAFSLLGLTDFNGTLIFENRVLVNNQWTGQGLWKSNGTSAGTTLVRSGVEFPTQVIQGSLVIGNSLYFSYYPQNAQFSGNALWKMDATPSGGYVVSQITTAFPGVNFEDIGLFSNVNGILYFMESPDYASNPAGFFSRLWKSDGTAAGTKMLKEFRPLKDEYSPNDGIGALVSFNGTLYFLLGVDYVDTTLWKSDGTTGGTVPVKVVHTGSNARSGVDVEMVVAGDKMYFPANDGTHGEELWQSDGTAAGTSIYQDLASGSAKSFPTQLTNVGGTLYFVADNQDKWWYSKLWRLPYTKVSGGILSIPGSANADLLTVTSSGSTFTIKRNGVVETVSSTAVSHLEIQTGGGDDVVDFSLITTPVYADSGPGNDLVIAGAGPDTLTGGAGKDTLRGGAGDDRLNGYGTADRLFGDDGNDRIYGGDANDYIEGGNGVDRIWGGYGNTTPSGNDFLVGGSSNDKLFGEDGADTLSGVNQDDLLDGGSGNDQIYGGTGADTFVGGDGDDILFARDRATDQLDGGNGNDSAWTDDALDIVIGTLETVLQ